MKISRRFDIFDYYFYFYFITEVYNIYVTERKTVRETQRRGFPSGDNIFAVELSELEIVLSQLSKTHFVHTFEKNMLRVAKQFQIDHSAIPVIAPRQGKDSK